jgi:hypothetical protein
MAPTKLQESRKLLKIVIAKASGVEFAVEIQNS